MKFIDNLSFQLDTMLGHKLPLTLTLILLEEAAQVIVCDQRQSLTNFVCAMNLNVSGKFFITLSKEGENVTATKVLDEVSSVAAFGTEDEDSLVSDKALKVSERISNQSSIKL